MSLFHPFRPKIKTKVTTPKSRRFSGAEIQAIRKSLNTGRVLKSFRKGRALNGNNANATGLTVQTSKFSNMADVTNELQGKRLLRETSDNIIVQSILRTRDAQVMKFCHPARFSNNNVGYVIKPRHVKKDGKLTKQQRKDIKQIERFIYNTGCPDAIRDGRDKFPDFVTKLIRNKYVYDQINVERIYDPDNTDKLDHFNIVDAGSVVYNKTPATEDDKRSFLQFARMSPSNKNVIHFDPKHMTFVTTHGGQIDRHGYGYSEVEAAMDALQAERQTTDFNVRFFSQGGTTRGILLINTEDDDQASEAALKALRQQWQSTAQGLSGAWKIPVISANDAKYVNLTQSTNDMEFERWLNYLINIICGVFQIQPDEINFPNRGGGATSKSASSSINEGASQRNRMQQSKDKGLWPLMNFIQDFINDHILNHYMPQYRFMFTLGDDKDEERHEQIMQLKLQNGMTVNEWRKQEGLTPLNSLNGAFNDIPGQPQIVVQEYNALTAQNAAQDKLNQAQSDVKQTGNPNHQNTMLTNQKQQNQQDQDKQANKPNGNNQNNQDNPANNEMNADNVHNNN